MQNRAEGNVIPVNTYKQLYPQSAYNPDGAPLGLCPSSTLITAFGGHTIQHYGTCELNLSHNGHSKPYPFHVVNTTGPTILGLPTCRDMKLVTLNYSLTTATSPGATKPTQEHSGDADAKKELLIQYEDCFKGIGCFQGEFHITLDPTVPPVIKASDIKIRCTEIPFFGNIISDSGRRPDPQKTEAILNMDPSASLADLQTFLGMVQFLSRFVPNLASLSANLWDLTKKSSEFQ